MSTQRLVQMANDIAANMAAEGEHAELAIATHLRRYWDPRMREQMQAHLDAGGAGLAPLARAAVRRLREM